MRVVLTAVYTLALIEAIINTGFLQATEKDLDLQAGAALDVKPKSRTD